MHIEINEGLRSMLIVEDEAILALMMEDLARELGIHEIHVFADVASALEMAAHADIDCAVLDVQLRDGDSLPVANLLAERNIPFFFSTGSDTHLLAEAHRDRPTIDKPFSDDDFKRTILDTWSRGRAADRDLAGGPQGRVASVGASD